jgi:hypothetical protein
MKMVPSSEEKQTFWHNLARELSSGDEVFVANEYVLLQTLRDAMGEILPGLEDLSGEAALFFIDKEPRANWAHSCEYVLLRHNGSILRIVHGWPPHESIPLLPLR